MRFLTFGAGAIGSYIGGSLALNGQKVVFVDRPEIVPTLKAVGFHLLLQDGEHHLKDPEVVSTVQTALEQGPFDAAIVSVKSFDTPPLLEIIQPFRSEMPPFFCIQNGVENEAAFASVLGADRVIAGTVTTAIGRRGLGSVALERMRGVGVAGNHPIAKDLVSVLDASGLSGKWYSNPASMKWSKMVINLIANASSAILDLPPAVILGDAHLYRIEILQLREALRVMDALNIPVTDLPGTAVRALCFLVRFFPTSLSQPLLLRVLSQGRGAKMPSFHIDLHAGRGNSEVDFLNGAVVRFGQKAHVPTPVNQILRDTLMGLTSGEIPLQRYAGQKDAWVRQVLETGNDR